MPRRWLSALLLIAVALAAGAVAGARGRSRAVAAAQETRPAPPARPAAPAAAAAAGHGAHGVHGAGGGAFDWGAASERDLAVASVFLTARDSGVRPALDRLRALAERDPGLADMGHVVTHALGRFAVARNGYDPAVFAQCRQDFQSGCFHGVMEGYFTSPRAAAAGAVEPRALDALCPSIVAPGSPRLPLLECAHGMGHGLTARGANDFRGALRGCDALSPGDARAECHDGVFMEVTVRGTEPRPGTNDASLLRRDDLRYPCDSVAAPYQPSCWKYQPIVIFEITSDVERTVRACAGAPAASMAACHHGVGKQSAGWFEDVAQVVQACRLGVARHLGDCLAGAAESYIDDAWTPGRALALCRAAPGDGKAECYRTIGARMALIHPSADEVARDCAPAEPAYVAACAAGARARPL